MNYHTNKTAYKNSINTQSEDVNTDDELDDLENFNTSPKGLKTKASVKKKIKFSSASNIANRNADQQNHPAASASRIAHKPPSKQQPLLRTLDKAETDAPASDEQVERAIDICKDMAKEKRAIRITNQSQNWQAVFAVPLDPDLPARHAQNPSVTLYFVYRRNNADVPFRLQLNPHKLNARHTDSLIDLWTRIWPVGWRELRAASRYHRVDEASDAFGDLDYQILDRKASQVTSRYYTQTGRGGKIKTAYIGEHSAENGGVLYDRFSSEVFRNADGDPVQLNRNTATHTFDQVEGVIRVESRRVFKPKLTYAELCQTPSALSEYFLFDLSRLPPSDRRDTAFMGYVEIVRLRGMHGAKHRLINMQGETAQTKRMIADYERRLASCQCEWWTQLDRTQQLGALLTSLPVNKFLKYIGT
ncbi:MAG TPA: hypothetical protein PK347_02770 [Burkholderiaceae bacterium]|nr:hypothetical protein [Burkholderiaceae bacterium]